MNHREVLNKFIDQMHEIFVKKNDNKSFDNARTKSNAEVIYEIALFMKRFPSLRFTQALACLKIDPEKQINEEPQVTLARIRNTNLK